jgi:hypothetical protein
MSEPPTHDEVPAMLAAARRTKPDSVAVTPQSRLKADLALRRREMRSFLLSYRKRFGIGPADENQFLLRYFDTQWKDEDHIKSVWLCGRRMLSRNFAIRWERFEKADMRAEHFISCAATGQWSLPEVLPLSEQDLRRIRSGGEIAWDAGQFMVTAFLLPVCFLVGFLAGPVIGFIWVLLCSVAVFCSLGNFRREVRARSD